MPRREGPLTNEHFCGGLFPQGEETIEDVLKRLHDLPGTKITQRTRVVYASGQVEKCPKTNRLHVQAYVQLSNKVKKSVLVRHEAIKGWFLLSCLGSSEENKEYVGKEESRVDGYERIFAGEYRDIEAPEKGLSPLEEIKERIMAGEALSDLELDYFPQFLQYGKQLKDFYFRYRQASLKNKMKQEHREELLRPWQKSALSMILSCTSDRKVHWFWESTGNVGKSWFLRHLMLHHRAEVLTPGKRQDLLHVITQLMIDKDIPIVAFDCPRTFQAEQHYDPLKDVYTVIEYLKNRVMTTTKYNSMNVVMELPAIVVVSNNPPDYHLMSEDRYNVVELSNFIAEESDSAYGEAGLRPISIPSVQGPEYNLEDSPSHT